MITRHRASHSVDSSRPKISYPIPVDQYDFTPASAPPTKSTSPTPRARVPASTSMARNWLSRASTSSSGSNAPYTPSKPVRISEPKLSSAFDAFTNRRRGPLGSGATVVRTPHDALAGSTASVYDTGSARTSRIRSQEVPVGIEVLPTSPLSPPLPPIPDEAEEAETEAEPEVPAACSTTPPRPSRAPPPTPEDPDNSSTPTPLQRVRSAIKNTTPPQSEYSPPVPELPANIPTSPPQPAFEPILVSSIPTTPIDPAKLIVSVETSTNTHRTTLKTLLSRPSYLATYVKSILPSREMDEMSLRSQTSEAESSFNSIFHNHLTSSGFLHQSSTTIHIFLDRPSAPYAHILTYLRSPPSTPENPATLPRPVQLISSSSSRLDALLELRDEARYLDLEELYKLCTDEIRTRHPTGNALGLSHARGISSTSLVSSSRSLGTLREGDEEDERASQRHSKDSGLGSGSPSSHNSSSPRNSDNVDVWHSSPSVLSNASNPPPTVPGLQQRALLRGRARSDCRKEGYASMRSRPTGAWI